MMMLKISFLKLRKTISRIFFSAFAHIFGFKGRVIIGLGLILILIMGVFSHYLYEKERERLFRTNMEKAEMLSAILLQKIADSMGKDNRKDIETVMLSIPWLHTTEGVWILSEDRDVLISLTASEKSQPDSSLLHGQEPDKNPFVHYTPIKNHEKCTGCHRPSESSLGFLAIEMPQEKIENEITYVRRNQMIVAVLIFLFATGSVLLIYSYTIRRPLDRLLTGMRRIQAGDLRLRIKNRTDDLNQLYRSFDEMLSRLQESERHNREHHLEQISRADRLANLGELAAATAHEINNPAGIILTRIGYLLHHTEKPGLTKSVVMDLKTIEEQTMRISKIVKGLLHFSKVTTYNPCNVSLNELVNRTLTILTPRLKQHKVNLFKNFNVHNSQIYADPDQIEQVILNIVNNAIDAMPYGGNLVVKTEHVNEEERDNTIELSVLDTGMGVPGENIEKIFSPFFTTKERGKGTGLGLSVSYGIVKTHGGRIEVRSELGKGSEFRIYMPHTN